MGQKIDTYFIELLEITFRSIYLSPDKKILSLVHAISRLDTVKFFCQIAWESKMIDTNHYSRLASELEEIGRMLGGWKKGIETNLKNKTPTI